MAIANFYTTYQKEIDFTSQLITVIVLGAMLFLVVLVMFIKDDHRPPWDQT